MKAGVIKPPKTPNTKPKYIHDNTSDGKKDRQTPEAMKK